MPRLFQGDDLALPSGPRFRWGAFGEGRAGGGGRDRCPCRGAGGISWHISAHPRFSRHLQASSPSISQHLPVFPIISQHLLAPRSIPWGARESVPCSPAMG